MANRQRESSMAEGVLSPRFRALAIGLVTLVVAAAFSRLGSARPSRPPLRSSVAWPCMDGCSPRSRWPTSLVSRSRGRSSIDSASSGR